MNTEARPPLVSVVMTAWNCEGLIGNSIESILRQTFADFELIVVDDGSTDGTGAVAESFRDPRIRVLRRPHLGIVPSANFGISQARGKYIARLDADDLSLPDRLEQQVRVFLQKPETVLCYTDIEVIGDVTGVEKRGRFVRNSASIALKLCFGCPLTHSSVLYRKDAFERVGGYFEKTFVAEDYSLYVRLIREGPFAGIPRKLVQYRRQSPSASTRHPDEMRRLALEIGVGHIQSFLDVEAPLAEEICRTLGGPYEKRDCRLWAFFCRRALRHPSCWSPEPLGWMLSQTVKTLWRGSYRGRAKAGPPVPDKFL